MNTIVGRLRACATKPSLRRRALLAPDLSSDLAALFKVLANESRLRLLHALARARELSVTALAEQVEMKVPAVSNQLQTLADKGIVDARRGGNNIFYRIIDPCVLDLLDRGLCLTEDARKRSRK